MGCCTLSYSQRLPTRTQKLGTPKSRSQFVRARPLFDVWPRSGQRRHRRYQAEAVSIFILGVELCGDTTGNAVVCSAEGSCIPGLERGVVLICFCYVAFVHPDKRPASESGVQGFCARRLPHVRLRCGVVNRKSMMPSVRLRKTTSTVSLHPREAVWSLQITISAIHLIYSPLEGLSIHQRAPTSGVAVAGIVALAAAPLYTFTVAKRRFRPLHVRLQLQRQLSCFSKLNVGQIRESNKAKTSRPLT